MSRFSRYRPGRPPDREADARDVVQEASLSAWRQLSRLRDSRAFGAWLGRTLINSCRMQLRRRSRVRAIPFGLRPLS
ncbi:MAG: hypothetical protein H0W22_08810 [Chloroflexi bacterium]|nr:hypothetical protein [Chloroflexota bacterium]